MAISETPAADETPVTTSYLWCGDAICQARDAGNAAIRGAADGAPIRSPPVDDIQRKDPDF